jgi:hypothetical protein
MKRTLALTTLVLLGCGASSLTPPAQPLSTPAVLCDAEHIGRPCRTASEVEAWLKDPRLQVLGAVRTPKGKQKAKVLTLAVPTTSGKVVFRAKWRADSTQSSLNDPRRELAAYAVQKLFLPPEQYVVPPAAGHCFPIEHYRARVDPAELPSFDGTNCVYGILSYWLEDAKSIDQAADTQRLDEDDLFDEDLFWRNAAYRRSLADVNLVAHLISHGDSHPAQFVVTGDQKQPRVHVVDNTIAFSDYRNPKLDAEEDWSILHVPALSAESVLRLRRLHFQDVLRLGVIERFDNREGQLVRTSLPERPAAVASGIRWVGSRLEVGLTRSEIDRLWRRLRAVVQRVDAGEIRTF